MNGRLGADHTDAVALFAQLMPTLAKYRDAIEFVLIPFRPFRDRGKAEFFFDGLWLFSPPSPGKCEAQKLQKKPDHLCIHLCAGLF
jgi:hypothetical protein